MDVCAVRVNAAVFLEILEDFGVNSINSICARISPVNPNKRGKPNLFVINFGNKIVIPVAANINEKNIITILVRDSGERLCARRVIGNVKVAKLTNQIKSKICFVIVLFALVSTNAIRSAIFIINAMKEYPG